MSSTPKSINRLAPERRPSQDVISSSPHREATNRLLSSSPSIPPFFARPASRQSNNSGGGSGSGNNASQTPTSSWRSPSTLQNYRSDDVAGDTSSNNYNINNNNNNRSGLDSSSNSIHGSYAGSNSGYLDSMNAVVDIPADEASKVVKKHLVLNSASRDSFDSDRNDNVGGPSSSSNGNNNNNSNNNDGTGSGDVVDYTTAFKLPGGAITRDVYKWQADQENEQNRRGNS